MSGDLRGAQDQWGEADFQARSSRGLTRPGAQFQLHFAATGSGPHGLKQFACPLASFGEQGAILSGANVEVMPLFFAFGEVIKNVSPAVTDLDPDDIFASGVVEPSPEYARCAGSKWALRIDAAGIRHASDVAPSPPSSRPAS